MTVVVRLRRQLLAVAAASLVGTLSAQSSGEPRALADASTAAAKSAAEPADTPKPAPDSPDVPAGEAVDEGANAARTELNLLGEVDSKGGEAQRNENVRLTLIDNNVLKELNQRMGTTATITQEFQVSQGYFGKEFGGSPSKPIHLPSANAPRFRGQAFWGHNNSISTARSFFQVGDVKPARTNDYGFNVLIPTWKGGTWTVNGSQRKLRGQVNSNVLVPAADERTPLTNDPRIRPIVEDIIGAFPAEVPNRLDINPRALNTNARQDINNDRLGAILDQAAGERDRFSLKYNLTLQNVKAFQLVGGQNPDTTTKNHQARITWNRAWSPKTTTDFSIGYDRIGSLLVPEETSLGTFYRFARILESIGPSGNIPIDRAQNLFRYSGQAQMVRGSHTLTMGFEILRRQTNGFESNDHRGKFNFRGDFGRDVIDNMRYGTPSVFFQAIGDVHRGFRNWDSQFYIGDQWKATQNLTLNIGLRYRPISAPTEVNNLSEIPYDSDYNNFGPSFGFAYRVNDWSVLRASYGLFYGEIFPATYMQARFNPPGNLLVVVNEPDLADPLKDFTEEDLDPTARSSFFQIDERLSTPYSHQYNFSWEMKLKPDWNLELGYVGSRSHKLLTMWYLNRGQPVEGIPQTTRTVNERRADQRFFDIQRILNGSRGYFDAAKVRLRIPRWAGLTLDTSYWFSKAIDIGANYTGTASGRDGRRSRSPYEFDFQPQMRGLSVFDQPHAWLTNINYETPTPPGGGWLGKIFGQWQLSGVLLLKAGTPFEVGAGSDGPGRGNVDGSGGDRPNIDDPSILGASVDHPDSSAQRLPKSAFSFIEPTGLLGNVGRNTFRKDGIVNLNAGLSRRFPLSGDRSLLFRAESLNVLNHPQFAEPGTELVGDNFGQITNTLNDGRSFRFLLRLYF